MTPIVSLDLTGWEPALTADAQRTAVRALEGGGVLTLPHVAFELRESERRFLSPTWSDGRAKNISFDGARIKGAVGAPNDLAALTAMIARFAASASGLVCALFPRYAPYVRRARTSFRPQPAVGRAVSWRKDDSRLHVDAFPSRPNHGERILRVFNNVNPRRRPRLASGRGFRDDGDDIAAARQACVAGDRNAAFGAARDQGCAQRLRSPHARVARPREVGPCRTSGIARSRSCASPPARPGCAFRTR